MTTTPVSPPILNSWLMSMSHLKRLLRRLSWRASGGSSNRTRDVGLLLATAWQLGEVVTSRVSLSGRRRGASPVFFAGLDLSKAASFTISCPWAGLTLPREAHFLFKKAVGWGSGVGARGFVWMLGRRGETSDQASGKRLVRLLPSPS